ncbi:hypothetical protein ScalyP_jg1458 [Parmales sp. scaly parma]|nr:hypothetical protein ScalyP_jg1458 [Parmales sp. scaly parma]
MGAAFKKLLSSFQKKKISISLIGLENSGKSTLLSVLMSSDGATPNTHTVPTVGLDVKTVTQNKVEMKVWDVGGAKQYRSEWARYVDGSDVVIFVVDVSDPSKLPTAQAELSVLLANDAINHIPFLILGNKIDVNPHLNEVELIQGLLLTDVVKTPWIVMPISAIKSVGIESVIEWLVNVGKNT